MLGGEGALHCWVDREGRLGVEWEGGREVG